MRQRPLHQHRGLLPVPVLLWVPAHAGRQPLRRHESLDQNEIAGNSVSRYESNILVSGLADINECERPSNCLRGRCINSMGSYHCECQKGYVLVGGRRCQGQPSLSVLITIATKSQERPNLQLESLKLIFKCSPHSKMMILSGRSCNNVVDGSLEAFSHLSLKTAGVWIKSDTDGGVCLSACLSDVDECATDRNLCQPYGSCENRPGSYSCVCNHGYVLSEDQRGCEGESAPGGTAFQT